MTTEAVAGSSGAMPAGVSTGSMAATPVARSASTATVAAGAASATSEESANVPETSKEEPCTA